MDDGADQVDEVSAEPAEHSLMLRFAKEVFAATGVPVGVIPGSSGGSNLYSMWQPDPWDHQDRGTLYGSLLHRVRLQGYGVPPRGLLWFQGEADATVGRPVDVYRNDLVTFLAVLRADVGDPALPVVFAQIGTYTGARPIEWIEVQEAQREVEEVDPRAALVPSADEPRSDAIHFTVDGYKSLGVRFAEAARKLVYGQPIAEHARVVGVYRRSGGSQVEIVYDQPVSGGHVDMYWVLDGQSPNPTVTSVSASGNSAFVNLARPLVGAATIDYGYLVDPALPWVKGPRGNAVPCFFQLPIP